MAENLGLVIAGIGITITILSSVGGLVWKLARQEAQLRAEFNAETAALKEKVYQVEIWARDEFVRKGSFDIVVGRLERGFADLRSEIGGRLDRMSEKIDHIGAR
jgi:hypothetical protein